MVALLLLLVLAVAFIIVATARWNWHPFLVLLAAGLIYGMAAGLTPSDTVVALTGGFGGTLGYIGIVIAAGTIIGTVLERTGGALVMAESVVSWIGPRRADLAMGVTGSVVSVPVFCDSGFIILAPLARSLAARTGGSLATFTLTLSMGLYATHVFVPPTPGPIAAAGELGADLGTVILLGLVATVPVVLVSYLYARIAGRRITIQPPAETFPDAAKPADDAGPRPSALRAFLPVVVPVVLIALQSIVRLPSRPLGEGIAFSTIGFIGDPNVALLLGVALAFLGTGRSHAGAWNEWTTDALKLAGPILLITGAGGGFGRILQSTSLADQLAALPAAGVAGTLALLLPFIVAAGLKTALGSSTVAIITTASIVAGLLPVLGLDSTAGLALTTLAIGAGSMTVSHANDSYFWVVSQFSGMSVSQAYRLQTAGSLVAGVTGIVTVLLLSLVLL